MLPLRGRYATALYPFLSALAEQEEAYEKIRDGDDWSLILFAEHPEVYTYDPRKAVKGWLFKKGDASSLQAPLIDVPRGGSITFHGPGQLVCYFVLDLKRLGISVFDLAHVIDLSIGTLLLSRYGIQSFTKPDSFPAAAHGRWVTSADGVQRKIASRGLSVQGNITRFGCAINLATNLWWFDPIYPCGIDIQMTSVEKETDGAILPSVPAAAFAFADIFRDNLIERTEQVMREKRHS